MSDGWCHQSFSDKHCLLYSRLLGMNCASPTDFNFSFRCVDHYHSTCHLLVKLLNYFFRHLQTAWVRGFKCRGGKTDVHSHGWGLAIYENRGVRTFHDPLPCSTSPLANLISSYPIKTYNMMAHIRYATQGAVSLENVVSHLIALYQLSIYE